MVQTIMRNEEIEDKETIAQIESEQWNVKGDVKSSKVNVKK